MRSRPFECTRCHNTFARKDTLQRYVRSLSCAQHVHELTRLQAPRRRLSPATRNEEARDQVFALAIESSHQARAGAADTRATGNIISGGNRTLAFVVNGGTVCDGLWRRHRVSCSACTNTLQRGAGVETMFGLDGVEDMNKLAV